MSKGYQWVKKQSLKIFVALVITSLIYAPYGMYKENQAEANAIIQDLQRENAQLRELYRPELILAINKATGFITDNKTKSRNTI